MKIFCPVHKRSFLAPRTNPIRCENKAHVLGELDFVGGKAKAGSPFWEYCCNCEHFWPSSLADEKCPVCNRQISARYLCDHCYTFSLESPDSAGSKNFTITPGGGPQPSCPACLNTPTVEALQEHQCFDLGVSFVTTLEICPICQSSIRANLSFPSTAHEYLRSKAIKQVRFDYELEMLVEAEDGDLVLLNDSNHLILLPKSNSLATKEHFYESYQDYFHCMSPAAGEIIVTKPATVESVGRGWRLSDCGILEIKPARALEAQARPQTNIADEDVTLEQSSEPTPLCPHCGAAIDQEYAKGWGYCWHCGEPLQTKQDAVPQPPEAVASTQTQQITPTTPPASSSPFRSSIFEAPTPTPSVSKRSLGVVLVIGFLALVIVAFIVWWIIRSPRRPNLATTENVPVATEAAGQATTPTPIATPAVAAADDEVSAIRKRIEKAASSDRTQIVTDLRNLEQKYPADYRFPYERAKLSITGVVAHDEAFAALVSAAERAISGGHSDEMLNALTSEKETYFKKTSRGHEEWNVLMEALKTKDKSKLQSMTTSARKAGH